MYTLAEDINRFKPAIRITRLISRQNLTRLRVGFFSIAIICTLGAFLPTPWHTPEMTQVLLGVSFLAFAFWVEQILIYCYHNTFYFYGLNSILGLTEQKTTGATYEVAEVILRNEDDVVSAFCLSPLGQEILLRSGIATTAVADYLKSSRPKISATMIPLPPESVYSLTTLGEYLLKQDPTFKAFVESQGIMLTVFTGALHFVVGHLHRTKKIERWWGKDNLSRHQGIGREWSYGTPYLLEKFSRSITTSAVFSTLTQNNQAFTEEKIAEIEVALARAKAANVILIGEAGVGKVDLIMEVDRRLQAGKSLGAVTDQRMILLDTNRLFAMHRDKPELEYTLLGIFTEAINAGNIIIVIENLSAFIREAEGMGIFIPEILDPFLASPDLHVIATDTPGAYHTYLEPLGGFARRFAEVLVDAPDLASTTRVLEGVARTSENRYGIFFTYPALVAITSAADRYLVEGAMPDKAIELLLDIATRAVEARTIIITPDFVYHVISQKTGIPAGPIGDTERNLLLNLETTLHDRVIGQQRALDSIARTMRRARAGIQASDKPIGSFLFLGPTGVGKTETAKALARIFFGSETNMHRLDMSEFSGSDALTRLIGTSASAGTLPDMLREHPYAVLLLDEFEKAARPVHDLFLQILDEGIFTDARGGKVNARNTIIIATSNAGSKLIIETVSQRQTLATLEAEIINHIIKEGVYRPELLNRFDSTIIFEPLTKEEQGQIAGLMLGSLYTRVKERGYELTVNRDLLEVIVDKGYSPEFGARPMQRVLQDLIEEKVAQKIISGAVTPGDTLTLTLADFTAQELAV